MGATHVIGDVFGETDGFDWGTSKVACADETAAKIEKDLCRPGALGISRVPQSGEQPL